MELEAVKLGDDVCVEDEEPVWEAVPVQVPLTDPETVPLLV